MTKIVKTFRDMNGYPICPGDLLRSFHFRERRYRRKHYLYHTATTEGDRIRIVPTCHLEPTKKNGGGACLLDEALAQNMEIILGSGPGKILDFRDRKRAERGTKPPTP